MSTEQAPLLAADLKALAQKPSQACSCSMGACAAWESVPGERWPAAQLTPLGSLRPADRLGPEPTYEECHPHKTRYDSVDAPIAPAFFPYNRCDVFGCGVCGRVLLKYTEYGGYYVDDRVRAVRADLVIAQDKAPEDDRAS
ncbi:hypothetical protein [Limnohabitans lacus]|jgi:hypothetical protein|uniref:Ferredoxin n=1 Tax=Limnohabitans lacus TaxID=3045173 RepID=A0ABT6X4A8_9BURK|nr:hypothetical protein [Limnohabitans sp. HM2-2]MDI9232946.1 hypothetical protein [Limnohabitans sp. HM2-2]